MTEGRTPTRPIFTFIHLKPVKYVVEGRTIPGGQWIQSDEVDEDDGGEGDVGGDKEAEEEGHDDVGSVGDAEGKDDDGDSG